MAVSNRDGLVKPRMQSLEQTHLQWLVHIDSLGLEAGRSVCAAKAIETNAQRVWEAISRPGSLKDFHPFCKSTTVETWPGPASRDTITYYSGVRYQRNFVAWYEGAGYDIELGDTPDQTAKVLWWVEGVSSDSCSLSIEVIPLLKKALEPEKNRRYEQRLFGYVLRHYLECVLCGVRHFAMTGVAVTEDQFGTNPHYSA